MLRTPCVRALAVATVVMVEGLDVAPAGVEKAYRRRQYSRLGGHI